jgi:hypothetical protein
LVAARPRYALAAWRLCVKCLLHGYGSGYEFTKLARAIAASFLLVAPVLAPAGTITFDHASGYYESPFSLKISVSDMDATIYYTTNGDTPRPATALRYSDKISVTTTIIVRAAAFNQGKPQTSIGVRTFLFPSAILGQTGAQLPITWGSNGSQPIPAHYEMSVAFAKNAASHRKLVEGLRSLPALSIVTDQDNLFSAETGIYLHPAERGAAWERPATIELFNANGRNGFQIDCGFRIHGGMSRQPEESPKHSFRLVFRERYGNNALRFPLFGTGGGQEFNDLILRAGNNDSWLDSDGIHRRQATYIRDEWMRRSMQAMGYPSARGSFVHLYLNGLYWGLYNLCERPSPSWLTTNQTNAVAEFDFRKGDRTESGDDAIWSQMLALANSGVSDDRNYGEIGQLLDLPALADYMILNFYAGNSDWDRSANWIAARPRTPDGRFRFFVWDAERTLEDPAINTLDFDDDESPLRLFHKLSENAAFRKLFAARVQRLLFDSGPLSPETSEERYRTLADSVAKAMTSEAARWGNYRRELYPFKTGPYEGYTAEKHWQPEVNRILTRYFPQRRGAVLNQFRERGLFPVIETPKRIPSKF